MVTIVDVCRLAGVSKATVSRVLNNTGQVKESTREAVLKAMQELAWRPNALAQAHANQRSDSIGLIISNFGTSYFGSLLSQAAESCDAALKYLIVTDGHNDPERELAAINMLVDRRCDAIVLYSRYIPDSQLLQLIRELPVPLVVMNRLLPEAPDRSAVFEQNDAAKEVVTFLLEQGHRRIACIAGRIHERTAQQRLQGYKDALAEFGVPVDDRLIVTLKEIAIPFGYSACQQLLGRKLPFTALFCCTDTMAEGSYRALAEAGLRIPDDVSVFGFDNVAATGYMVPSLSTVNMPIKEMTKAVFEQAIRLANNQTAGPLPSFPCDLIHRESVAPPSPA